ncbi:hypothetical protein GCM10028801_38090 [Nocardioides maradonensis]
MTQTHERVQPVNDPFHQAWYGVYPATVSDNQDPDGQGRVKVKLPWIGGSTYEAWARLSTLMGGGNRGSWFVPDKDDEVLVAFAYGDVDHPYVVGALWNGKDSPPKSMDSDNNVKAIVSRKDIEIVLDDTDGAVALTISTPGGHQLTLQDAGATVTLEDSNGNSVELAPDGMTITAASKLTVNAPTIEFNNGSGTVNSAMWTFSGVVQNNTTISTAVVSSSYTPGAGNVW